jgi:hypothetical protein
MRLHTHAFADAGQTGAGYPMGDGRHRHDTAHGPTSLDVPLRRGGHVHALTITGNGKSLFTSIEVEQEAIDRSDSVA